LEKGKTPRKTKVMTHVAFLQECDNGMVETLSLLGRDFKTCGILDIERVCEHFGISEISAAVKFIKNFVSFWIPYCLGDELPPGLTQVPYGFMKPQPRSFFQNVFGRGGRFGRRIIRLAGVIAYSKRLFPNVPDDFVEMKLKEYQEKLSREDPDSFPLKRQIKAAIKREVESLGSFVADFSRPFAPSTSSCLEETKATGGLQNYVRTIVQDLVDEYERGSWIDALELSEIQSSIDFFKKIDRLESVLEEYHSAEDVVDMLRPHWASLLTVLLDLMVKQVYCWDLERQGYEKAEPVGLLEPLKVRIITKQSWYLNLLKPLQRAWHDVLRNTSTYQLVGGANVESAIQSLPLLKKGEKYVSGDYEAATDNIYLWATEYTLDCLLSQTTFEFPITLSMQGHRFMDAIRTLAWKSFCFLKVRVPVGRGPSRTYNEVKVNRGQMMGNILSFPILCIINAAVTRLSLPSGKSIIVNGDDVAFSCTPKQYRNWKYVTSCVGLKFSLGKNYFSDKFVMINSQYFSFDQSRRKLTRIIVPNVGLLNSSSLLSMDKETGREVLPTETLSSLWRDFDQTLLPEHKARGLKMFQRRYRKFLLDFPGSLFGPRCLGNLGAPVPADYKFTRMERIWMEAHRTGEFDYREGRTTEYSRIVTACQKVLKRSSGNAVYSETSVSGCPDNRIYSKRMYPIRIPDPYSRGGGLENSICPVSRWFYKPSSKGEVRHFVNRRWRRFLKQRKNHPILSADIGPEALNNWTEGRRRWSTQGMTAGQMVVNKILGDLGLDDVAIYLTGQQKSCSLKQEIRNVHHSCNDPWNLEF